MTIIAITNTKGGSGKSTTAVCLAAALGTYWGKTVLIDVDDDQATAANWLEGWRAMYEQGGTRIEPPATAVTATPADVELAIKKARDEGAVNIIIDTIGTGKEPAWILPVLQVCDLAVVPLADSLTDLATLKPTRQLIEKAAETNAMEVQVVLTQVRSGTRLTDTIRSAIEDPIGLPVAASVIPMREALKQGNGSPLRKPLIDEVIPLAAELVGPAPDDHDLN